MVRKLSFPPWYSVVNSSSFFRTPQRFPLPQFILIVGQVEPELRRRHTIDIHLFFFNSEP
jgi:hypothetical protein